VNGRRVEKGSAEVKVADVITLPKGDAVLAVKLLAMPARRGPASEAQSCYQVLE
jgi:ribosome-associated heat shock protein Hsp15